MSTVALIGTHAPSGIKEKLSDLCFEIFSLKPDERLPLPIRSHADTLLSVVENKVFFSKEYADSCQPFTSLLISRGYDVVKCECEVGCEYPADISFNVAIVGKYAFGKFDFVAQELKRELVDRGYTLIDVKQGYAKCLTTIISDNAIITADSGIAKKASALGIDVLKVSAAESVIELDGYGYGFIGGACAMHENTLYSCGNIELHPDYEAIRDFCEAHGVALCSLSDGKLCDLGGILFIN
jgi:hypothetical protein